VSDLLPVLWLCGPSGVGKSTAGWELFTGLPGAAYVDIDQLGMCYPELPSDPGRTLLEGRVLGDVVANFRAAGASCLVVSGYIDSRRGIHTEYLTWAVLDALRLRCDPPELRRRLEGRARAGEPPELRDLALSEAVALDRSGLPYPWLDTTGRTISEVIKAIRDRWPNLPGRQPGPWPEPVPTPGEIVWVCGATAVGKSTVGFEVASALWRAGHTTGFVDLQQIGFQRPLPGQEPSHHRLRAANLGALWRHFHAHGARHLVVVGPVERPAEVRLYADALPTATMTVYRLHAGPDQLRERIRQRGLGGGPDLAGDNLRGQPAAMLDRIHESAVAQAEALERAGLGDERVDTDGRTIGELAREILTRIGWTAP
jgi:hypothetical protein